MLGRRVGLVLEALKSMHWVRCSLSQVQIEVGAEVPSVNVELVTDGCAADDDCKLLDSASELLFGKSVLIGMPGAFTPTCNDLHLPGYIRSAPHFKRLGVDSVAVVTTNDRFIMTAWKRAMRKCMDEEGLESLDDSVKMLADPEGDLVRQAAILASKTRLRELSLRTFTCR